MYLFRISFGEAGTFRKRKAVIFYEMYFECHSSNYFAMAGVNDAEKPDTRRPIEKVTGTFKIQKGFHIIPPLWTDLVKILTRKPRHASSFSLECTNFKNVIFEKIP
jgi:hypothetical protein